MLTYSSHTCSKISEHTRQSSHMRIIDRLSTPRAQCFWKEFWHWESGRAYFNSFYRHTMVNNQRIFGCFDEFHRDGRIKMSSSSFNQLFTKITLHWQITGHIVSNIACNFSVSVYGKSRIQDNIFYTPPGKNATIAYAQSNNSDNMPLPAN